ncbi:MAG: hypothetical protein L6U99_00665 [Clostridium sp.]|nr:MAG: hypothetical protein L6U99_00665 [Clostridium sp.]
MVILKKTKPRPTAAKAKIIPKIIGTIVMIFIFLILSSFKALAAAISS